MIDILKRGYEAFLSIIFPKFCISCNKEGDFICDTCFETISFRERKVLKPFIPNSPIRSLLIPCDYHRNPLLKRAVHLMKYTFYKEIVIKLASIMIIGIRSYDLPANTHLVPIPLHRKRLKFRGFNQAELLALAISSELNIPICNLLERTVDTGKQAELNREERLKNVKNIFRVDEDEAPAPATPLLLVDDICTTLSTMNEAAITLQKSGYKIVFGAAIARA